MVTESPTYVARTTLLNMLEEIKEESDKYLTLPNLDPKYVSIYKEAINRAVKSTTGNLAQLDQMLTTFELMPDNYIDMLGQMTSALTVLYDMIELAIKVHVTSMEKEVVESMIFGSNQPQGKEYKN